MTPNTDAAVISEYKAAMETDPWSPERLRCLVELENPRVALIDGLLTPTECETLIALIKPRIKRSTVVDNDTGEFVEHPHRTSSGSHFQRGENELVAAIEARISNYVQIPIHHGEGFQILHYGVGGEYRPHFDYFDPVHPGSHKCLEKGGQRVATVIMYLNEVEEGGETIMPHVGLRCRPRPGQAVFFYNMDREGKEDPMTLHGGAPVIQGEKWIMTKWLRVNPYE